MKLDHKYFINLKVQNLYMLLEIKKGKMVKK